MQIVLRKIKKFLKNKLILKTQQRFKSEKHNDFTEVINKIVLSSSDDKIMQSIDSIEIICTKVKIKHNIIKQYKNV